MSNSQMKLEALRAAPDSVEGEVIRRCSIVTAGEALGHGVHLDESFVMEFAEQAEAMKLGLKARFGHPNMCNESLGTSLGRFRNFELSDDGRQLFADLHIGSYAHDTPHGDLGGYVLNYAKEDPESFGTSIVFQVGGHYRKDKDGNDVDVDMSFGREEYIDFQGEPDDLSDELYVRCEKAMGCDFVDEPAANPGGLFSSVTPAGQVQKFFKDHPEVEQLLSQNDNVVDIIEQYGVNIKQFLNRRNIMTEDIDNTEEELLGDNSDIPQENCQDLEETPVEEEVSVEEPVQEAMSVEEFKSLLAEFGSDVATEVFDKNGTREDALELALSDSRKVIDELNKEREDLLEKLSKLDSEVDEYREAGASFASEKPKKRDITANIKF